MIAAWFTFHPYAAVLAVFLWTVLPLGSIASDSPIALQWFVTTELDPPSGSGYKLYRTREIHETPQNDGVHANYYLIKGPSVDLLVDTGFGLVSLRSHLQQLSLIGGDRPLLVLATHEHFDHAGGLHHFADAPANSSIIMGWADADAVVHGMAKRTDALAIQTKYASNPQLFWDAFPEKEFEASLLEYAVRSRVDQRVQFGDIISLGGNVSFKVLELPGHTPGSIGLWNVNGTRELYAGDAIYDATLYDFESDSDKSAYRATMEFLKVLNVSVVYPGHEEVLNRSRYFQIIDCYLSGINPCPKHPFGDIDKIAQDSVLSAFDDDPTSYILKCEAQWAASCETGDITGVKQFLAEDFIGTVEQGQRYTKAEILASTNRSCQSNHFNGANFTRLGDVIVVFGNESWVDLSGRRGIYIWTDTWAKRRGAWQIVAASEFTILRTAADHHQKNNSVQTRIGVLPSEEPVII